MMTFYLVRVSSKEFTSIKLDNSSNLLKHFLPFISNTMEYLFLTHYFQLILVFLQSLECIFTKRLVYRLAVCHANFTLSGQIVLNYIV